MAADDVDFQPAGQKKTCSQRCHDFSRAIWNPEKHEFLGRTASSWAKIGLFYLIFYSCLAGFFAIMLAGFFTTLSEHQPKQTGMYSLIKGNPGMGFRPKPHTDSTLIKFSVSKGDYGGLVDEIDEILKSYANQTDAEDCEPPQLQPEDREKQKVCKVDLNQLTGTTCTKNNSYGYKDGKPCVLLKVNKVFGWVPEPYSNKSLEDDDDSSAQEAKTALDDRLRSDYIGVTCEGENEGDADNIRNTTYYPNFGFSYSYFPYANVDGYIQPLVFVQFEVRHGVLIQVWCKLWAENIMHHKNDKAGSTHFELLVDL